MYGLCGTGKWHGKTLKTRISHGNIMNIHISSVQQVWSSFGMIPKISLHGLDRFCFSIFACAPQTEVRAKAQDDQHKKQSVTINKLIHLRRIRLGSASLQIVILKANYAL